MEDLKDRERGGLEGVEPITFLEFSQKFIENHFKEKSLAYKRRSEGQIRNFYISWFGEMEMSDITFELVSKWKTWREKANIAPKTLREDILLLQLMFKAAIKNNYALINPVDDIDIPKNIPIKKQGAVQDQILRDALRKFREDDLLIVLALRNSGLRVGELFRVDFEDVNFETKLIRVKSILNQTTKNYQERHTILTPTMIEIIRLTGVKSGRIFTVKRGSFDDRFFDLKKKYAWTWNLHSLRHTFITKLRSASLPERVVAHYVGHAQKSETDRYTSFMPEFIDKSIAAADFGREFLSQESNVVTLWSPQKEKGPDLQDLICARGGTRTRARSNLNP